MYSFKDQLNKIIKNRSLYLVLTNQRCNDGARAGRHHLLDWCNAITG